MAVGRKYVEGGAEQIPTHPSREEAEAVSVGDFE
jgi:hypothetical protein